MTLPSCAMVIGVGLSLIGSGCATPEKSQESPSVGGIVFSSDLTFIKTVPIRERHCVDVRPSQRELSGCLCPLGDGCNCFIRVSRIRDGRCQVDVAYWTRQQVYRDVATLPDGGIREISGIAENCFDCWTTMPLVHIGSSTQACGEEVLCR